MKKVLFFLLLAAGCLSFTAYWADDFTITGTAPGIADGTKVFLQKQDAKTGILNLDTAQVKAGVFSFKGVATEPSLHFFEVEKVQGKIAFILEKGKIKCTLYKDSIGKSIIGGTKNNEDLQSFNSKALKVQKRITDFQKANNDKFTEAKTKNDTVTINQLVKQLSVMQNEMMTLSANFPQNNPKSFISILFIDNMFNNPKMEIAKIKSAYEKLDVSLKNTKPGKELKTRIDNYRSVEIGSLAPEFSAPTPEGKTLTLKESLGKITIIDFWASWCGPCRRENPNVVKLYNDYHAKGLNIVGVSLDKEADKWKEAIAKDGLVWSHLSNLKFWQDPIAVQYHVQSIPATFLLDAEGRIIARDLRGEELRAKVASLLDKQ